MRTHVATRLIALILSLQYVARIQTSLNSCDRSQRQNSVAATMIFTRQTRRFVAATCRGDVSQRFLTSCVSVLRSSAGINPILNPTARCLPNGGLRTLTSLVGVHVFELTPQFIETTLASFSATVSPLFSHFFAVNHLLHWIRFVKDSVFFPYVVDSAAHDPPIIIRFFENLFVTPFERLAFYLNSWSLFSMPARCFNAFSNDVGVEDRPNWFWKAGETGEAVEANGLRTRGRFTGLCWNVFQLAL